MTQNRPLAEIDDFLGSARLFASAVHDIVEQRILDGVAGGRLTVSQVKLLKLVARTELYTLGDVASFLHVSNAAASRAVERMVRRNLLRRTEDEKDRRATHVSLTPAARQLLDAYEAARRLKLEGVFGQFPRQELRRAAELLDRISAQIVDYSSDSEELGLKSGEVYFRDKRLARRLAERNCFYERRGGQTGRRSGEE